MKTIRSGQRNMYNMLPNQIEDTSLNYVPHKYFIENNGIVFNCITGETVGDISWEKDRAELIRRWFLVPEDFDISGFIYLMRQIRLSRMNSPTITDYTIFTTMQCNARCPYCFQNDRHEDLYMSHDTALDVAKYIKNNSDRTKRLTLRWFGGEPLLNRDVINTICCSLRDSDYMHRSYISTNGDLLPTVTDGELYLWNLKIVQLSIDYPGEEYDKVKGLPSGAYERLIETTKRLDELGVESRIRIHYHSESGNDPIFKIIDDFKDLTNSNMYISPLFGDHVCKEDFDKILEDVLVKLRKLRDPIPNGGRPSQCMADNKYSKTITAEGGLTPCEHYSGEENYGSIYSDIYNEAVLTKWRSKRKHELKCTDCPLFPTCEILTACPAIARCEDGTKEYRIERTRRALSNLGGSNEQRQIN